MELQDKVIVLTGGAGGLGGAMAHRLGRAGASVALVDLNEKVLREVTHSLTKEGINSASYACDITDETSVENTFNQIVSDFGRLDGLINNAGIIRDGLLVKVQDGELKRRMSLAEWRSVIDVNLTATFLCGREAAANMAKLGNGGCIINIASISAQGNLGQSNYSASKAGVIALAVTWAKELAGYNIRCAAISPGFVRTPLLEEMKQEALARLIEKMPMKRLAEPDEIAQAAEFIFRNDYFNGRVIEVDGALRI